jgi:hypothetical protein
MTPNLPEFMGYHAVLAALQRYGRGLSQQDVNRDSVQKLANSCVVKS